MIDNEQTWAEALNINPENLNEWSAQAPPGKPLLVWCLEQGHVDMQEYLLWASERFGLPVLSSSFFESGGLDPEFFKSRLSAGAWNAWSFPIEEWDGVTFVACVEPPPEERPEDVRYVLADPRAMLDAWETNGGASAEAPPELDAPVGINLETKIFKLNFDDTSIMMANTNVAAPPPPKKAVPEESVIGDIGSDKTSVAKGILKLDDSLTMPKAAAVKPAPTMPPAPSATKSAPPPSQAPAAKAPAITATIPRISVVPAASDTSVTSLTSLTRTTVGETSENPPDLSQKTAITRFATPVEKLDLPSNESAALTKAFAHINKVYKHALVLRVANSTAKFYKADPSLKADPDKALLNLDQPSCLRIVLKTGLPYHGYLVDTPLHREFFSALGGKVLPDCVTAVPLKVNGRIWGVLMAMGTEELQTLESLGMVEGTAVQLLTALGPTWARAA